MLIYKLKVRTGWDCSNLLWPALVTVGCFSGVESPGTSRSTEASGGSGLSDVEEVGLGGLGDFDGVGVSENSDDGIGSIGDGVQRPRDGQGGLGGASVDAPSDEPVFVTLWDTTVVQNWEDDPVGSASDEDQIRLPLVESGDYDFVVRWGDGTQDRIQVWDDAARTHTYEVPGEYQVEITGRIVGWSFGMWGEVVEDCIVDDDGFESECIYFHYFYSDVQKLKRVSSWGPLAFGGTEQQFNGCVGLEITATDTPDLSYTSSLREFFGGCRALSLAPSLGKWDTSTITDMSLLFSGSSEVSRGEKRPVDPDLSSWDTSKVTDMSHMFEKTTFNQNISAWDTSRVRDMSHMFTESDFNQDISGWNTSQVTDMSRMFAWATSFDQDLSAWDIDAVESFSYMFAGVELSTDNYDALLIGWSQQEVIPGASLNAGLSRYSPGEAATARASLVDEHGWVITDGGSVE